VTQNNKAGGHFQRGKIGKRGRKSQGEKKSDSGLGKNGKFVRGRRKKVGPLKNYGGAEGGGKRRVEKALKNALEKGVKKSKGNHSTGNKGVKIISRYVYFGRVGMRVDLKKNRETTALGDLQRKRFKQKLLAIKKKFFLLLKWNFQRDQCLN